MTPLAVAFVLAIFFAPGAVIAAHAEIEATEKHGALAIWVAIVAVVVAWPVFVFFGSFGPPDDECW